jgi:replication-associated recombination protein RarA
MNHNLENLLRPRTVDEIVGNAVSVRAVKNMLERDLLRPLLISGPWGSGKTALADVIRDHVSKMPRAQHDLMRGGSTFNCVDQTISDLREYFSRDQYGEHRVLIFDEADQLNKKSQTLCLTHLNKQARAQMYIFCTSEADQIIGALQGRLFHIEMQRLTPSERTDLIARAWKDERAQATLWARDDEDRKEFTTEVNKRGLNIARYIYNALDEYATGTPADVAVQGWLERMPATERKKLSKTEGVARVADILNAKPDISHSQLAQELGGVAIGTVREWRKIAESAID